MPDNVQAGNLLRVTVRSRGAKPRSIIDTAGNTYTLVRQRRLRKVTVQRWFTTLESSTPLTITTTFEGHGRADLTVQEISLS